MLLFRVAWSSWHDSGDVVEAPDEEVASRVSTLVADGYVPLVLGVWRTAQPPRAAGRAWLRAAPWRSTTPADVRKGAARAQSRPRAPPCAPQVVTMPSAARCWRACGAP